MNTRDFVVLFFACGALAAPRFILRAQISNVRQPQVAYPNFDTLSPRLRLSEQLLSETIELLRARGEMMQAQEVLAPKGVPIHTDAFFERLIYGSKGPDVSYPSASDRGGEGRGKMLPGAIEWLIEDMVRYRNPDNSLYILPAGVDQSI